jgi:transposase-like protein
MFTSVDPATVHRWDMRYSRELLECFNHRRRAITGSERGDEIYVWVGGRWKYLFRAIDKHGQLNEVTLPDRRNTRAAYRFLRNALKTMGPHPRSQLVNLHPAEGHPTLTKEKSYFRHLLPPPDGPRLPPA